MIKLFLKKYKRFLHYLLSLAVIFGLYTAYDIQNPDCVDAQTCVTIRPGSIIYGTLNGNVSSGRCGGTIANVSAPGTGNAYVALTGWDLFFTSTDHHVNELAVIIGTISQSGSTVTFPVSACVNDQNNDDAFSWEIGYVVVRWN